MFPSLLLRSLLVASFGAVSALATLPLRAADLPLPLPVPTLPAAAWELQATEGDTVSLDAAGGVLALHYDVAIERERLQGHMTVREAEMRLLLRQPVALPEGASSIAFEAAGMVANTRRGLEDIQLCPLLRDASGEQFTFYPTAATHLSAGSSRWSGWSIRDFYSGEAGGASISVYSAAGGDGNTWPDGQLTLLGFVVQVRDPKAARKQGTLLLGDLTVHGVHRPYQEPFAYADAYLKTSGTYTLKAQIRNQFQGLPVREISQAVVYDADSPLSRKQRLAIPLGPNDVYWVDTVLSDATGAEIYHDASRVEVANNPDTTPLPPLDPDAVPAIGSLRLRAGADGCGVLAADVPFTVQARVYLREKAVHTLTWKLLTYRYDTVVDSGTVTVQPDGKPFADLTIAPVPEPGRNAYRLVAEVSADGGKTAIDSQTFYLGIATGVVQSYARRGKLVDRHALKQAPYFRSTYLEPDTYSREQPLKSEAEAVAHFSAYLDQAGAMANDVTYMLNLRDFEVLPGVYDFVLLDQIMDAAAARGRALTIRLSQSLRWPGRWPKYHQQVNYTGEFIEHAYYGAFAVTDPVNVKLWHDAFRALHQRYGQHPGFQGYYLMEPGGEWTVVDKPWSADIAGYSQASIASFRQYLREVMKLTLPELNARWGTAYASWDAVEAPLPTLRLGAQPDLRLQWLDFCRFKRWMDNDFWFPGAIDTIRSLSDTEVIIAYTILINDTAWLRGMYGKLDYLHNGGNLFNLRTFSLVDAWRTGGIGWISEPHHPHHWAKSAWVLDRTVWTMLAQAEGGGANLHIYYFPNPVALTGHYGRDFAYDRFEKFKPILRELSTMRVLMPTAKVATVADSTTLYTKHRTTFESRQADLERWFDLLDAASVPSEPYRDDHAADYQLLVPNILNEVLSKENHDRILRHVQAGGKAVISANTGSYVPEIDTTRFQLLRSLGIQPPTGAYVQQQAGVTATTTQNNGLLPDGQALPFFALADLQADLRSPEVRAHFFDYPYRWIPETDYFGAYLENTAPTTGGQAIASFPNGAPAASLHRVGKGEVLVFWGTPDVRDGKLVPLMKQLAKWATGDASAPLAIPETIEGTSDALGRHYLLCYQTKPGVYRIPMKSELKPGRWFLEELVSDEKLGYFSADELATTGVPLTFRAEQSPLRVVRLIHEDGMKSVPWNNDFRNAPQPEEAK